MADLIREFEEYLSLKKLSQRTMEEYTNYLKKLLPIYNYRKEKGLELEQEDINIFLRNYGNRVSRAMMKNFLEFLNRTDLRIIKVTGSQRRKKPNIISDKDAYKIAEYLLDNYSKKYYLMFLFSLQTGVRKNEILNFRVRDIKEKKEVNGKLILKILIKEAKRGKERYVILKGNIAEELVDWINENCSAMTDLVFPRSKSAWYQHFKKAVRNTCDTDYKLHEIRHTAGSKWNEEGVPIAEIRDRLGHDSIATTNRYISIDQEKALKKWEEG